MIAIKDFYKQLPDHEPLILNRLREFCKHFSTSTISYKEFIKPFHDIYIRCLSRDYILRLSMNDDEVVGIGLLEYPNCDLMLPEYVSQTGDSTMQDPSSTIVPSDPEPTATPQEILTFVDDTATQEASLPMITTPDSSVLVPGSELRRHTIEDILKRPTKITQQKWTTSQLQNTDIYSVAFPDAIIDASSIIKDKLQNFTFLRADICVRVIINASTFQQGKLLAYFAPFSRVVGQRAKLNEHLPGKTAFPHIVLDAATGNSGDLRIPFVNPYSHYNLTTQQGDMGNLQITVLNQLKTLTDCTVTVFAWFENIDLGVPTARPNMTLANARNNTMTTSDETMILKLIKDGIITVKKDADTGKLSFLTPYKSQVAEDREKSQKGIISATLEHIGGAAAGLSKLPVLGDTFKPVEWIANSAAGISASLGLCKPTSVQAQEKFQNTPGFGYTNTDGLDQSLMLACKPDNQLEMRGDLFGSGVDEMDLSYVTSHSNWFQTFKWASSVDPLVNPKLNEISVHPGICPFNDNNYQPTLLAFASAPCQYWRGGLTYKVQVAKTAYHSGRIRIAFVPSGQHGQNYNLDTCYSWILDLRTSDQIEFTIPYISNTQYKSVILAPPVADPNVKSSTGVLVTEVLNALRAPDTVEQSVEINMWIAGASDYITDIWDFDRYRIGNGAANASIPKPFLARETKVLTPAEAEEELDPKNLPKPLNRRRRNVTESSDEDYDFSSDYSSQVLGNFQDQGFNDFSDAAQMFGMNTTDKITPRKLAIGEDVNNIRSLIKRFGFRGGVVLEERFNKITVSTGYFGTAELKNVTPLDYFSWIYRFYRGSTRFKIGCSTRPAHTMFQYKANDGLGVEVPGVGIVPATDNPEVYVATANAATSLPASGSILSSDTVKPPIVYSNANFSHRQFVNLNPFIEVTAPYYSNVPILPITAPDGTALQDISYNALVFGYDGNNLVDVNWDEASGTYKQVSITSPRADVSYFVAAGDDFQMGWLVGAPYLKDNTS